MSKGEDPKSKSTKKVETLFQISNITLNMTKERGDGKECNFDF